MNSPLPTVPHAVAAAGDLVACGVHRATLPALACARRHVARDWRGHRSGRDLDSLARYPSCAGCALGAVARERLGVRGSPGVAALATITVPRDEYTRPLGDVRAATMRPVRVEADELPRTPVVRHPLDVWGCDDPEAPRPAMMPWGLM